MSAPIWCKICGVTRVEDALLIQQVGADAIGLNFYPQSSRYVSLTQAAAIAQAVQLTRVGLFVDPTRSQVDTALQQVDLDLLQFHGAEDPQFCSQFELPYIKVIRMRSAESFTEQASRYEDAWAFLLDTFVSGQQGGTGHTFDWSMWPQDHPARLILAGGLGPQNVASAIDSTHPFGVDVASGVEASVATGQADLAAPKGAKHAELVRQFVNNVRECSVREQ